MYGADDASSKLIELVISVISEICLTRRRLLAFFCFACLLETGLIGQVVDHLAGITTAVLGLLAKALLKNSNEQVVDSGSSLLLLCVENVDRSESCLVRLHVVVVFASSTSSREGIRSNSVGPGSTGMKSKLNEGMFLVRKMLSSLLPLSLTS